MHLCFVCEEYPPAPHGGTGSSYRDLGRSCRCRSSCNSRGRYPSKRLKLARVVEEQIKGVRVVRMPNAPKWMRYRLGALWDRRRLSSRLSREHARIPIDVIEASDYAGWLRFGGPHGVPTVVRIRGLNLFFDTELAAAG